MLVESRYRPDIVDQSPAEYKKPQTRRWAGNFCRLAADRQMTVVLRRNCRPYSALGKNSQGNGFYG
ncbi:hypothetical protein A1356_20865 [Methylomonas koyamae]|uniref:Uncharacterized protein n=1 Tax=Methylomonas koyamae TaxID=702114 RepID=A0AA91D869_9GAMM|nr:hypothetical protein A1356_20865 [Methylomonas koyamae]